MSGVYEGLFVVVPSKPDCKKVWSYHPYHQNCPFDDIGFGEVVFAVYGLVCGIPYPSSQELGGLDQRNIYDLAEIRKLIHQLQPVPSEYIRIQLEEEEEGIVGRFLTAQETCNKLDKNSCILLNISLDSFEPDQGHNWWDLMKTLSTADTQQAFRDPFPLNIKKLDQKRLETLYPKADLQEYSKSTAGGGKVVFENIHVVFKFSRSGCKTEGVWNKGQQLMGNKLLAEGLLSDFAIKAGGKTIPCHRNFLAGRSAVFAVMFASNYAEVEKGTYTMEDMSAEGVEGFLKYVCTGSLYDAMGNSTIAFEMLRAGHKYEIEDLEFVCKEILESAKSNSFDAVTAFEMYRYCGNVEGLVALKTKAVRVLKENAKQFQETGAIGTLLESIQSADARKVFNDWMCSSLQYT